MAVSLNKSVIGGNLTSDIELKQTTSGISVARASVAVHRKRAKQGEQQKTDFIECVFWRHSAEFLSRYAHKGDNVVVCGELQNESWTDAQAGRKGSRSCDSRRSARLHSGSELRSEARVPAPSGREFGGVLMALIRKSIPVAA